MSSCDPKWQDWRRVRRTRVDHYAWPWLVDSASLTQRLINVSGGQFHVQVLHQGWSRPELGEACVLGVNPAQHVLLREVHLFCAGKPTVYARTVIPRSTISGAERRLTALGNKPLGAYLFSHPKLVRAGIEIASIKPGSREYQMAAAGKRKLPEQIWGRRSLFCLGNKPLLVTEVFLPTIPSFEKHFGDNNLSRIAVGA